MKLLYDYEIFARQKYGGVSRYFYEIIAGLALNYTAEIDVFLGTNISGYNFEQLKHKINLKLFNLHYNPKFHFAFYQVNKYLFNKYTSGKKFDIFHKTYYSDVGINLNCKVITTVHDMTHELYPSFFVKNDGTTRLKKNSVIQSDAIICVSETTKRDLVTIFDIDPENIRVIYHGITLSNNRPFESVFNKPYLLYVGQRWGYKNFSLLLSAYASDKNLQNDYSLICFGGGNLNYSEKLFIKKNNLKDKVIHMTGDDNILSSLYKNAGVFIYTSLYEGFGFPPLEAMEFGCPVLSSPGGSISEVLSDAALYFDPQNSKELLSKLYSVLNGEELRKKLIEKGNSRVREFSWEKSVAEHFRFYNELIL